MAQLTETLDTAAAMMAEVLRDPQSESAAAVVQRLVNGIHVLLETPEFRAFLFLPDERRRHVPGLLRPHLEPLFRDVRALLSVAFQLWEVGGQAIWVHGLVEAMARLAGALSVIGIKVEPFVTPALLPVPPMVAVEGRDPDGAPRVRVLTNAVRRLRLAPYIAVAMAKARAEAMEDGRWFAELDDDFPGVWADGASREDSLAALADVLHEWIIVKAEHGDDDIPVLGPFDPRALIPAR